MNRKFIDKKLLSTVAALFISIMIIVQVMIHIWDTQTVNSISKMYVDDLIDKYQQDLQVLSYANHLVASNDTVQNLFITNDEEAISTTKILEYWLGLQNINNFLTNMGLTAQISVYTLEKTETITHDNIIMGKSLHDAPWFNEYYTRSPQYTTPLYMNNQHTMFSIVSNVYDKNNNILGAVSIDITLADMLEYFVEHFHLGSLDLYLQHDYGITTTAGIESTNIPTHSITHYIYEYTQTISNEKLIFIIDKSSVRNTTYVERSQFDIIFGTSSFAIIISMLVLITIKVILHPVAASINNVKNILLELGDTSEHNFGISYINDLTVVMEKTVSTKIKELLFYDGLTKLPNRQHFNKYITKILNQDRQFALIVLEIRDFKSIHDGNIEGKGDIILVEIARRFKHFSNHKNVQITRFGEEKFILILQEIYTESEVMTFYHALTDYFAQYPINISHKSINILFDSVGIICPQHASSKDELFSKISIMSNQAKELAINDIVMFDPLVYQNSLREDIIRNILKVSITNNEFFLNYQPIIDKNKVIKKAEALVRWKNSLLGFVYPDQFIHITEQTELIIDLGYWIIERVSKDMQEMYSANNKIQISINVSPIQIRMPDFVSNAKDILDRYNIHYSDICFEITESALLQTKATVNENIVTDNIEKLQAMGIRIAMDDFGTGYSSFNYLNEYNFDILKLDKLFVNKTTTKQYEIINSIKNISDILNMEMIIEGVETQEQFDIVKNYGLVQGYYFSKPIEWDALQLLLQQE
ncbi:putative bifunctional diguanylate cyclase/phosphodiesterase [Candidatus Epulonipiscium viviparus]|uniref:putative bifunctional diguanylate cyclase/phosphodiesterase n=1 Tax=Candidatus Epulonipiscium viviparus TaxID=420336 RepID=UPI0027380DAD|nr:bifunctional diguanylate cyclase/phosphodiesterase [Candidatus Epulopiscium viviparus]